MFPFFDKTPRVRFVDDNPDPRTHVAVACVNHVIKYMNVSGGAHYPPMVRGDQLEVCSFDLDGDFMRKVRWPDFAKKILSSSRYSKLLKDADKKFPGEWGWQAVPIGQIGAKLKKFVGDDALALKRLESKFLKRDLKAEAKRDQMKVTRVLRDRAKFRLAKTQEAIRKLKAFEDEQMKILAKLQQDVASLNTLGQ